MADSMPRGLSAAAREPVPPSPAADLRAWTAYALDLQAPACQVLGSSLYAELLRRAAADVREDGPAWAVLQSHATKDTSDALALRFMAAVHRLVLTGSAPDLAAFFPSAGGDADRPGSWPVLKRALLEHRAVLTEWAGLPCQTNEVGRCAALGPGFLVIAAETGLPLRLLEIGASGGLNLRWDSYHYADVRDGRSWGNPSSPVQLRGDWDVPPSLLDTRVDIASRTGCDPRPVDPSTPEGRLRLSASIWGDQPLRFSRLRGALQIAADIAVEVTQHHAIDWLPPRLEQPVPGEATVVYHSVVLQYLDAAERRAVAQVIAAAGSRATSAAPLYWLRMEPEQPLRAMSVRLTSWPGGQERLLATAGAHGNPVHWEG